MKGKGNRIKRTLTNFSDVKVVVN